MGGRWGVAPTPHPQAGLWITVGGVDNPVETVDK